MVNRCKGMKNILEHKNNATLQALQNEKIWNNKK